MLFYSFLIILSKDHLVTDETDDQDCSDRECQIDEGAYGEHFRPKISQKKLISYPLYPKVSRGELGTSPPFLPVKERPLAMTLRMSPCTYVIHWGFTSPASLSLVSSYLYLHEPSLFLNLRELSF